MRFGLGSAVVDAKDTSGFFGGKAGLVAIFTHFKGGLQSQSIAYSTDKGRTWTKYEGNPVIPNPGLKDFRDPKVIWHEPTKSWVMVVSVDNRVQFYTSPDLKTWKLASEFGSDQGSHAAVWECPDLFELPVEGSKTKKWVLAVSIGSNNTTKGSTAQYFVGTFDGHTFKNDNPASDVLVDGLREGFLCGCVLFGYSGKGWTSHLAGLDVQLALSVRDADGGLEGEYVHPARAAAEEYP